MATEILKRDLLNVSCIDNVEKCNYIKPSKFTELDGINPITQRPFTNKDIMDVKNQFKRICNTKEGLMSECCDSNKLLGQNSNEAKAKIEMIKKTYPSVQLNVNNGIIESMLLSRKRETSPNWQVLNPHLICKLTKAKIQNNGGGYMLATNLVRDCFIDNCNSGEPELNLQTLLGQTQGVDRVKYTYFNDAKVEEYIRDNELDNVKEYIRDQHSVNHQLTHDDYRNRLIHLAAKYNNKELANMLIALETDINIKNKNGDTALHMATKHKSYDVMQILITHGASIREKNNNGETPIFNSISSNSIDGIRLLFNNGASLIDVDNSGNTLLHHAIKYSKDKFNIISYLIQNGVPLTQTKNKKGETSYILLQKLINISRKNNKSVIENFGVEIVNPNDYSPQHTELLKLATLLRNYSFKNRDGNSYLDNNELKSFESPVELIDEMCVKTVNTPEGINIDGKDIKNCVANGGQIVKIMKPSTKIAASLYPSGESNIKLIDETDLYYPIYSEKSKATGDPDIVKKLNAKLRNKKVASNNITSEEADYEFLDRNGKLNDDKNNDDNDKENFNFKKENMFGMDKKELEKYENEAKMNSEKFSNVFDDLKNFKIMEKFGDIVKDKDNVIYYRNCSIIIVILLVILFIIKNK